MKDLEIIRNRVGEAIASSSRETFIFDLLRAYGHSKTSVTRLESGDYNQAKAYGEVLWKKKLFFAVADDSRLRTVAEEATGRDDVMRHEPRFIVVTDFKTVVARDLKAEDSLEIAFTELPRKFEFFLPWAGIEKAQIFRENPADIKAAEKMAGLYDEILNENPNLQGGSHDLNVFFARILFCLFAEDTGIFEKDIFSNAVQNYTDDRGADLLGFLDTLFVVLDTERRGDDQPFYLRVFPYVNGGLFNDRISIPRFSAKARRILLECGSELNWSEINPDIFGSMVQAVVHEDQRAGLGMHYTSVPNIMKVIGPLFLDELRDEFNKAKGSKTKLQRLWKRIANIKFFDPACGSGNFLIITYKEIRKLEMEIIAELERAGGQSELYFSQITLDQFFGIEIDDFAHEVATLSLWLAEHQMNTAFRERFDRVQPFLPLKESGHIVCGNAARLDWEGVCPAIENDDLFVMGNPPYAGSRRRTANQKTDMEAALGGLPRWRSLDYISIWFWKGRQYVEMTNAKLAFVTTSSVNQGLMVGLLWPHVLAGNCEIGFAHQPFKWANNARGQAGVSVSIVSLRRPSNRPKLLFGSMGVQVAKEISPYLVEGSADVIVTGENQPPDHRPEMLFGNMARCGGNLVLESAERDTLLRECPAARKYLRPFIGANEILSGSRRWCLWISDEEAEDAILQDAVQKRLDGVRKMRSESDAEATRALGDTPHAFAQRNCQGPGRVLIIPRHSSERRAVIPMSYETEGTIVADSANAIFGAELPLFGLLSSKMHMCWIRAVSGTLEDRIRYSSTICYNTFPFPSMTASQEQALNAAAKQVIIARERHSEKTLAELYDPDETPHDLREAHADLDRAVDRCYRAKPFKSDEERLQVLFEMYEEMTRP